ncbi:hypothetical protein BpHYR1_010030 [Brachionus plicatilis]|uniref:Uncharacterized protein n=1 Tax=Brachionus plicatilis TaxID=10195 RepID=A0A3M7QF53_BRAPC|nr:hypothetical protein BpHYR1_010030 [Brachionus plicatilis]
MKKLSFNSFKYYFKRFIVRKERRKKNLKSNKLKKFCIREKNKDALRFLKPYFNTLSARIAESSESHRFYFVERQSINRIESHSML